MNLKHTKGPWESVASTTRVIYVQTRSDTFIQPKLIARVERADDAEFIVRACNSHDELIEALENLLLSDSEYMREDYENTFGSPILDEQKIWTKEMVLAKKALAKAKGEE